MKGLALAGVVLVFELILMILAGAMIYYADQVARNERKATEIVAQSNRVLLQGRKAFAASMDRAYHQPETEQGDLIGALRKLKELVHDNRELEKEVSEIEETYWEAQKLLDPVRNRIDPTGPGIYLALVRLNQLTHTSNRQMENVLIDCERIRQTRSEETAQTRQMLMLFLSAFAVLNVFVIVGLVVGFAHHVTKRLAILSENSMRLVIGQTLLPTQNSKDEIADLDRAMHKMARLLQEATQRERAVLENASDLICSITAEGTFASSNPAAMKVLGYTPDELIGKRFIDVVSDETKEDTRASFDDVIKRHGNAEIENRLVCKDRTMIDAAWSIQWSEDDRALFCVVHDISQRKEMERLKRAFIEMVSHDLRSPLTSMQFSIEMVVSGNYGQLPEQSKKTLQQITSNIGRLIALVNGLLSLEKMESGNVQLACHKLRPSKVIEPSMHSLQGMAKKRRIELIVKNENDPEFYGDEDRLVQVLVNLLSNAIKFSPERTTITIAVEESNDFVEIQVNDQGRGIPEDKRELVFERFKQVEQSDDTKKGGIGLGLPICKAIVEQHGGTIGADTADGGGCKMWFKLPKTNPLVHRETSIEEENVTQS